MSTLNVDKVDPSTGTALEIGTSGDTITIPSGATLDISSATLTPPATMPASSGINFTALNATNLGSGTVPDARFPATLPAASGVNLTSLDAANLGSNTVPTARLGSGTASSTTVLYGDQTYKAEPSGLAEVDMWRVTANFTGGVDVTANWARVTTVFEKIGTGMTESSGIFTFPSTGKYQIQGWTTIFATVWSTTGGIRAYYSSDTGGSFPASAETYFTVAENPDAVTTGYASGGFTSIIDVTDISTFQFKINILNTDCTVYGSGSVNYTYLTFMKLGST